MKSRKIQALALAGTVILTALPTVTLAGGSHSDSHGEKTDTAFGGPAMATMADRTIRIAMTDNAFSVPNLKVTENEVIRFVFVNEGDVVHEFNIGTQDMHGMHQEEMMAMMDSGMMLVDEKGTGSDHDDPNSILLNPGETGELTWKFAGAQALEFACNVPGHYESGMMGDLTVRRHSSGNS